MRLGQEERHFWDSKMANGFHCCQTQYLWRMTANWPNWASRMCFWLHGRVNISSQLALLHATLRSVMALEFREGASLLIRFTFTLAHHKHRGLVSFSVFSIFCLLICNKKILNLEPVGWNLPNMLLPWSFSVAILISQFSTSSFIN